MRDDVSFKDFMLFLAIAAVFLYFGAVIDTWANPKNKTITVNGCVYNVNQEDDGTTCFEHSKECHRGSGSHLLTKN